MANDQSVRTQESARLVLLTYPYVSPPVSGSANGRYTDPGCNPVPPL